MIPSLIFQFLSFSFYALVSGIIAFMAFFYLKYVALTKWRMRYYSQQQMKEYVFYPALGILKDWDNKNPKDKDSLMFIKRISLDRKGADVILTNQSSLASLYLVDPDLINQFLQIQHKYIKYRPSIEGFIQLLGESITLSEGEKWKEARKMLSNIFKFQEIQKYLNTIKQISKSKLQSASVDQFNCKKILSSIVGTASFELFLGVTEEDMKSFKNANQFDKFGSEIQMHYLSPFVMMIGQWFIKLNLRQSDRIINQKCKQIRSSIKYLLKQTIQREKENMKKSSSSPSDPNKKENLISLLLKEGYSFETEAEIEKLLNSAFNTYVAAKETTSIFLQVLFYYLLKNPQEFSKVYKEVDSLPQDYSISDLQNLNQLQANIKESLRLNSSSPIIFTRQAAVSHSLGKYNIQKGTLVNIALAANQYDEKYFTDPWEYKPERWISGEAEEVVKKNPFVFIPFSGGMRNCIGQHLALMEIKTIIVEFIRQFEQPSLPENYELEMIITSSYEPKNDIILDLKRRQSSY